MRKISKDHFEVKLADFEDQPESAGPSFKPACWERQATVEELSDSE